MAAVVLRRVAAALLSVVRAPPALSPRSLPPTQPSSFAANVVKSSWLSGWISAPRVLIHYVAAQGQLPSTEAKGYYNVGYGRTYY